MVEDWPVLVPLEDLAKKPYRELLAYPNPSDESVEFRVLQLKSLGIEGLEFEGQRLPLWSSSLKGRGRKARVKATVKAMLGQCVRLDAYGLDHGELSRAHKNVLISKEDHPWILDYESASLMRRVNNFTSLAQYILLSGRFSRKVLRILGPVDRTELVKYLRLYKSGKTNDAFESTLKLLQV